MYSPFYKKGFPEIKPENKGKFTAWAKKNGFKDACSAASSVMSKKWGKIEVRLAVIMHVDLLLLDIFGKLSLV